jgi:hypothetical protein
MQWQTLAKIAALVALIWAANQMTHQLAEALDFQIRPSNEDAIHRAITTAALLYAVLLALPFVPGAEIGIALMATLGPPIAFLVYVCTVAGLTTGFLVGRLIPIAGLIRLARAMDLRKIAVLLEKMAPLDQSGRLALLAGNAPNRFVPILLRYRHVGLGILFNTPGNFIIGGGGGISLLAGVSGLFSVLGFLLTVMISVSPVPIAVLFIGSEFLR